MSEPPSFTNAFSGFHDRPESGFYRSVALDLDPVETWEHLTERMGHLITRVYAAGDTATPPVVSRQLLCTWHSAIFVSAFPDDAGRLRWRREGEWEHVWFGIDIGTVKSRQVKQLRGAAPWRIAAKLDRACRAANLAIAGYHARAGRGDELRLEDVTYTLAEFYCKVLRIHPWVDGNLRAAFVALQALLGALDLPAVEFKDLARHDDMIGVAFQDDDRPYARMAQLVQELIESGATA